MLISSSTDRGVSREFQVVIVGGGPVGMGLAIELGQRGIRCLVIERHATVQPVPKGQNLTQRTMEHFHFWGAEKALRAARTIAPEYGIGGLTAYDTLLGPYHYDWLARERVGAFYFRANERLPQYETERVLRERVAQLPSVTVLYGWTAESLSQDGQRVSVEIKETHGEAKRTVIGRYLVGCDGSRSVVRRFAGITETVADHDRIMTLLVFRSRELNRLLERFPGKSFYNVLKPALGGYWLFFGRVDLQGRWFFHAPVPAAARDGDFDFAAYLHEAVGAGFDVDIDYKGFWDLRFALADTYRAGNVFLAGDAAHSHPPYGGYGVNSGLEDARNLGWKMAADLQRWGGSELLSSYHDERHAVFGSTARNFIENSIRRDRDFLAGFNPNVDREAFIAEWSARALGAGNEVESFEPRYCGSSIVWGKEGASSGAVGSHTFTAEAGRHLAPQSLSDGSDVFERLGPGFSLLAFDAKAEDVREFSAAAARHGIPLIVVLDTAAGSRAQYGNRLVLVRPDHFVAWSGDELNSSAETVLTRAAGY